MGSNGIRTLHRRKASRAKPKNPNHPVNGLIKTCLNTSLIGTLAASEMV